MSITILSRSPSFERHLRTVVADAAAWRFMDDPDEYLQQANPKETLLLIHGPSFDDLRGLIHALLLGKAAPKIGVASDVPNVEELLQLATEGISAYFNSYMADIHYAHMLRTLGAGQQWFAPQLQGELLQLAARAAPEKSRHDAVLESLTPRQRQIAQAVADGLNNKQIAEKFSITQRTVKAHLTSTFDKLGINSRLALATRVLNSGNDTTNHKGHGT